MRVHLGHHFYGAGNIGDDFMLGGFLSAMKRLAPDASFSAAVPFELEPLKRRFPEIAWSPYTQELRRRLISEADVWLGLGGSPFQSAQSRWFLEHLLDEAKICAATGTPMFYLGVGVQTIEELRSSDVQRLCSQAEHIWTRDIASADRLAALNCAVRVEPGADMAHVYFEANRPTAARRGCLAIVVNFDYGSWPGLNDFLVATAGFNAVERIWLAHEARDLPGSERALYDMMPAAWKEQWRLVPADRPSAALHEVVQSWPSAEWLVTSRYHAAIAGCWAGSRVMVIPTNEKLRGVADELGCPQLSATADVSTVAQALSAVPSGRPPLSFAQRAGSACRAFVQAATCAT